MANLPHNPTSDRLPPGTRVGVDTGGTFTDLVLAIPGEPLRIAKVPSTPDDPGRALLEGLEALSVPGAPGATVVHGTTVALNALLTGRTGRTRKRREGGGEEWRKLEGIGGVERWELIRSQTRGLGERR